VSKRKDHLKMGLRRTYDNLVLFRFFVVGETQKYGGSLKGGDPSGKERSRITLQIYPLSTSGNSIPEQEGGFPSMENGFGVELRIRVSAISLETACQSQNARPFAFYSLIGAVKRKSTKEVIR